MRSSTIAVLAVLAAVALSAQAAYVSTSAFSCMFPRVSSSKVNEWNGELNSVLGNYGINTWNRVVMFMAQTGQETDRYNTFTEYTNSDGTNAWCGRYDGGCTYRGRGAIQLTGKYNYNAAGNALGVNFVANPSLVATTQYAFKTAGWFWRSHNLNSCSDNGDVTSCTRTINGGLNGLDARVALYQTAKRCIPQFGGGPSPSPSPAPTPKPSPGPSGCSPTTYTVKSGDTLSGIASRFHTTVAKIASANGIKDVNKIYVGQRLTIPC
jgi:predicted chitinase